MSIVDDHAVAADSRVVEVGNSPTPRVAVVLLSKDEPALADSLRVLEPQVRALDGEVIVVDASEGRLDEIRCTFPWVRWIDYIRPIGVTITIPQQRNVGVRAALAPVVAFCDAGGVPTERWLDELVQPILRGELDVTCGPVRSTRSSVYKVINDVVDGTVVESVLTANLAFTRAAFDLVGGFSEGYEYGSDADFAWRLIDAGHPPISVQAAVMGMDWGDWSLQKKRSWRYGKARARLFQRHRHRRVGILTGTPEIVVYPVLVVGGLLSLALAALGMFMAPVLPAAALGVLWLRNRHTAKPWGVIIDHIIYSGSFFTELAASVWRRMFGGGSYVMHMPKDAGPYQPYLLDALGEHGVSSSYLPSPTGSKTVNLLLLPATMLRARLAGVRVVHVHWLHDFHLPWVAGSPLAGRLVMGWFRLWLAGTQLLGLRLVWTAHNVLPHNPIFLDDTEARIALVRHTDAIIAHTEVTARELSERFGAAAAVVIPQGATPPPHTRDVASSRARLGWDTDKTMLVIVGKVEPYKGIVTLLEELTRRAANKQRVLDAATLVIAGSCINPALSDTIRTLVTDLQKSGVDVRFDEGALSEQSFWDHLQAADVALFPFDAITNSGSLVAALSAGAPSVVTDLRAFDEIDTVAVRKAGPEIDIYVDAVLDLVSASAADRDHMSEEALLWAGARDWGRVATATRALYASLEKEGRR